MLVQHDMQVLRDAIQYLLDKKGDIFAYSGQLCVYAVKWVGCNPDPIPLGKLE